MGMWIELGVFGLVFVFAWHQLRDLKRERLKRERQNTAVQSGNLADIITSSKVLYVLTHIQNQ
jgi:hypothetical protein